MIFTVFKGLEAERETDFPGMCVSAGPRFLWMDFCISVCFDFLVGFNLFQAYTPKGVILKFKPSGA